LSLRGSIIAEAASTTIVRIAKVEIASSPKTLLATTYSGDCRTKFYDAFPLSLASSSQRRDQIVLHFMQENGMTIQSSHQIAHIIRNAIVFDVKNWPGKMMNSDSLIQSVQDLFTLLEKRQIDYALVGGIALLHYVEGRNTQDLDLLMAFSSLEKLPELKITNRDMYFVRANYGALQIDVLLTKNPLVKKVHDQYSHVQQLFNRNIPIATVEGLLWLKLYTLPSLYREGNFAKVGIYENDVAMLLHDYQPGVSKLLTEISGYVSENDLAEIKDIVADIQNRIRRFKMSPDKHSGV
jgi:hypothetical protein